MGGSPGGQSARACTHKRTAKMLSLDVPFNIRPRVSSGHGADLSVCPLMTQSGRRMPSAGGASEQRGPQSSDRVEERSHHFSVG